MDLLIYLYLSNKLLKGSLSVIYPSEGASSCLQYLIIAVHGSSGA